MSFREPSNYSQSLNKLYLMFNNTLDEMRKNYISFKLGNSTEYTSNLNTINNVKAEIFSEQQSIFSSTEKIKKEVDKYDFLINGLNSQNAKLKKKLENIKDTGLAAQGELKLQKNLYREVFIQNMVLSIIILIFIVRFIKSIKK
jgi:hypothetical protein